MPSEHAQMIRESKRRLEDKLADAEAEVEKVHADMRALERKCRHEEAKLTSHMGESCRHCFDCGACNV